MPLYPTTNADYFTFNVHNSALVVGQTGSGKTELVRRYIRRLERAFTPEKMQYVIYDLKQVEFNPEYEGGAKPEYLYTPIRTGKPEDMDYLEELAILAESRAESEGKAQPFIFIYIEECDMVFAYPGRFEQAVVTINKYAEQANMKLIYSTSRIGHESIPPVLRDSFDLILAGVFPTFDSEEYIGTPGAHTSIRPHEFIVKENK